MNLFEIKLNIEKKRQEAVNGFLNINSADAAEYRHKQGIIHGMDICLGLIAQALKDENDA